MLSRTHGNTGLMLRQPLHVPFWNRGAELKAGMLSVLDMTQEHEATNFRARPGDESSAWSAVREPLESDRKRGIFLIAKEAGTNGQRIHHYLFGDPVSVQYADILEPGTYFYAPPGGGTAVVPETPDLPAGCRCLGVSRGSGTRSFAMFSGMDPVFGWS